MTGLGFVSLSNIVFFISVMPIKVAIIQFTDTFFSYCLNVLMCHVVGEEISVATRGLTRISLLIKISKSLMQL